MKISSHYTQWANPTDGVGETSTTDAVSPLDMRLSAFETSGPAAAFGLGSVSAMDITPAATPIGTGIGALNIEAVRNQARINAFVSDDLVDEQWHLGFLGDMSAIWRDYTGKGVSVGVYDSGVDYRLSAFDGRYDASKEVVVDSVKYDGGWRPVAGPHGTAVAGLIAAAKDGNETVGIAYDSTVTGVNIFDPYSGGKRDPGIFVNAADNSRFYEAIRQSAKFDVVNNSWGPAQPFKDADSNRMVEGSGAHRLVDAITYAVDTGRGGLGTIAMKSAGNYGQVIVPQGDPVNPLLAPEVDGAIDSAGTDRHWISVGAFRQVDGNASSYSTRGAHLLISAPSDDDPVLGGTGIWTTDAKGRDGYTYTPDPGGDVDFTDSFGGTSAAAPIISGVVTLMLDANPNLGWRDVKDILAASAKMPVKFDTGPTSLNAQGMFGPVTVYFNEDRFKITGDGSSSHVNNGGYHFSTDYGYGAVNGFGAVRMAEAWNTLYGTSKTSANEVNFTVNKTIGKVIPDAVYKDSTPVTTPLTFTIDVSRDIQIEHLDVVYSYTNTDNLLEAAGSFAFEVTSPDGTTYFVGSNGRGGTYGENGISITEVIGLAGLRGETSAGRWTITVRDPSPSSEQLLKDVSLKFSGSEKSVNDVYHITDEFLTMMAIPGEAAKRGTIIDKNGGVDWLDMSALSIVGGVDLADNAFYVGTSKFAIAGEIEKVMGGDGRNYLSGDGRANEFHGMRGADTLYGEGGDDWLDGGTGNDFLSGGTGGDVFYFDLNTITGQDKIIDFASEDWLVFNKRLPGDTGNGVVSLNVVTLTGFVTESVLRLDNVSLGSRISFENQEVQKVYLAYERDGKFYYSSRANTGTDGQVEMQGTDRADTLAGNALDNRLYGLAGNDKLSGGAGKDMLDGGKGNDILTGGAGNDDFFFDNRGTSGVDRITDFGTGDRLVLTKALRDGNGDGIITFGSKGLLNLDASSGGDRVTLEGLGSSAALKLLGMEDGHYVYALYEPNMAFVH